MRELLPFIEAYLREVAQRIPLLRQAGSGGEVLGAVAGRSEVEDVEIGVDRFCDDLLESHLAKSGLRLDIHSEHGFRQVGGSGAPRYLLAVDPFDGSSLYRRGIPAEWWSVLSVYSALGEPLGGGAVDILRRELYLAGPDGAAMTALDSGTQIRLAPPRVTGLGDVTLAAYIMSPTYLPNWVDQTRGLLRRHPRVRVWPNGGSCIYPWLARGVVHAYLMFEEPRSEIDPGLGFAAAAGYPAYRVTETGQLQPYRFEAGKQAGTVPFFITAVTPQLADAIVREVLAG